MANQITLANRFLMEDGERQGVLEMARRCAKLSKPWMLPPKGHTPNTPLLENFQSLVARGITTFGGRMLMGAFPAELPFFDQEQSPQILNDPNVSDEQKQANEQALFIRTLTVTTLLESSGSSEPQHGAVGFRAANRRAIEQILVTGDTLLHFTPEYRLKNYRRDQYVTRRNSTGDVMYIIVSEACDPLTLTADQIQTADLSAEDLRLKHTADRLRDLITLVEYQPWTKKWIVRQEINGKQIAESEETVPQFFTVPYELVGGEHYGRGFIEQNRGDIASYNELCERMLDFAEMCTKLIPILDYSSEMRESDFELPTGTPLRGRVSGGEVQDAAFMQVNKAQDFGVAYKVWETQKNTLGEAMLMSAESVRQSERTTAYEVQETVIKELEGATGGFSAQIFEDLQLPLVRRCIHQAEKDKLLVPLPVGAANIKILTGIAALARAARAARLRDFITDLTALGPEVMSRINTSVLLDVMARYRQVREPGLIKTPQQVQVDLDAAVAAQAKQQAAAKAVDVLGNVAQAHAMPQAQQGAA